MVMIMIKHLQMNNISSDCLVSYPENSLVEVLSLWRNE